MAKKQLKVLTSSTTSLPKSVDSIIADDEAAFQSPPFGDEGQAAGARSAAEGLLNAVTSGAPVPSTSAGSPGGDSGGTGSGSGAGDGSGSGVGGGSGAGDGSGAGSGDGSGDGSGAGDGSGGAGAGGDGDPPAPGSVEEGAQILADQTAAAMSEQEVASPGEDLLDFGNGVLAYLANRLPMLGIDPCNFDPPGPPASPPYTDVVVRSGTDTDADNLDDATGEPITITTFPGGPYDVLKILPTTGLNTDQTKFIKNCVKIALEASKSIQNIKFINVCVNSKE